MRDEHGPVITADSLPAYLGAERNTNNTAELSAACECIHAALREESYAPVGIRPDSEYTVGILAGTIRARENVALATEARRLFLRLQGAREQVWIARVPAHQDDQPWNQRADALATRGLACGASKPDERWEGWRPIEGCDKCIGKNESCPVCKTTFADSPNTPSGAPPWMPSPAMSSRAASGLWNSCEHEPCRACVPDVRARDLKCPVCQPNHRQVNTG